MRIGSYGHVKENPMRGKSGWTIYHNPRCSKSRCALDLLRAKGVDAQVIEYMETPLKKHEIEFLLTLLKVEPKEILRQKEPILETLHLDLENGEAVIEAITQHPELLERPIIVHNGKALIARPPEKVWDLEK